MEHVQEITQCKSNDHVTDDVTLGRCFNPNAFCPLSNPAWVL